MKKKFYDEHFVLIGENKESEVAVYLNKLLRPDKRIVYLLIVIDYEKYSENSNDVKEVYVKELASGFFTSEVKQILVDYDIDVRNSNIDEKKKACKVYRLDKDIDNTRARGHIICKWPVLPG